MVKILAALVVALSILNSSGASPGATEKVAAVVARATCSGAGHSSVNMSSIRIQRKTVNILCIFSGMLYSNKSGEESHSNFFNARNFSLKR